VSGYLVLAEGLMGEHLREVPPSWNFGPDPSDVATVAEVAEMVAEEWGPDAGVLHDHGTDQVHEMASLRLDSSRARDLLGWLPRWNLAEAVSRTVDWHRGWLASVDLRELCVRQIADYTGRT
jgi:CDP-glucose 4,6-dehydratase